MIADFEHVLLRELAPACVVVDASGSVLHFSGPVGRYLEPQGAPSNDVVDLARAPFRSELRATLHRAMAEKRLVRRDCLTSDPDGRSEATEIVVRPLPSAEGPAGDRYLVAFRELRAIGVPGAPPGPGEPESDVERRLRDELAATRQRLQATIDELEASNREHRRANERLTAVNEELQASREELESLNEELQRLNGELAAKAVITFADITESKLAEAASRESEARLRQIVDSVPHLVWTATAEGTRDYFSQQWREYTGLSAGPQLDQGWIEAYHPDDREAMLAAWSESLRTGVPFKAEYRIRRHDGVYRWFTARANALRDASGRVDRWIGTSTDIDELKRLESSLREGSRRKDEFMALLGHELRNPLAPLGNCLDILRHHGGDRDQLARAVAVIDRQVTHLARLVDDLLDVSRITRGKIRIRRERVDLSAILGSILEDHRGLFATAGIRLDVEIPREQLWIAGDPARLAQMVGNLLHNAKKFTDRGGTVKVSLAPAHDGQSVWLRVRDSGIGMDPASIEGMFEAFTQADATLAHSRGGLGLGLTLVKALAELHGGTVRGRSAGVGQGSEFELRLPLVAVSAARAPQRAAPRGASRILVVDDNADAAETFADLLQLEGHEVRVAGDGPSALEEARRFAPDIAFCDIGLPGELDGYALARALRAEPGLERTVLIAMTGYAGEEDQRRTREAGFALHFAKPARIELVRRAIAAIAEGGLDAHGGGLEHAADAGW